MAGGPAPGSAGIWASHAESNLMLTILQDVVEERLRQIDKWGGATGDGVENPRQSDYVRLRVLAEEFGEVAEAMGRPEDGNGKGDLRKELVQVAAVAVAWIEGLDRARAGGIPDPRPVRHYSIP